MSEYFYEDFEIGNRFLTRTRFVSGSEIELLVGLVGATNPLFLNRDVAKSKGFKDINGEHIQIGRQYQDRLPVAGGKQRKAFWRREGYRRRSSGIGR